jgi:hypothetical protein
MYVWMVVRLSNALTVGWTIFVVFMSLFVVGWCPLNIKNPASKIGTFQMGPKTRNGDFLENGCNDFD